MKYIGQLCIILGISVIGEVLNYLIPLPVPASIYGLVIMLVLLCTKVLKVHQVKETSDFLLAVMPMMFIPAGAGVIKYWSYIKPMLIPCIIIMIFVTVIVMAVTGRITQAIITFKEKGGKTDA